jgi:ABC-type multidrug transport system ATPase subunit
MFRKGTETSRGASFEFRNVSYILNVKEKGVRVRKVVLDNISHKVKAGGILAIMGPSGLFFANCKFLIKIGAGKTTLLDILAQVSIYKYLD